MKHDFIVRSFMLIYVNITDRQTDRQTDKHIKSIVRNLTKLVKKQNLYVKSESEQKYKVKYKNVIK